MDALTWLFSSWEGIAACVGVAVTAATALWRHLRHVSRALREIYAIGAQFRNNGGSSFCDKLDKIVEDLAQLRAAQEMTVGVVYHLCSDLELALYHTLPNGECCWVSRAWCDITGMSFEDALGHGWRSAIHPDDRDRVLDEWASCVNECRMFRAVFRFQRIDNAVVWVRGWANSVKGGTGELRGVIGTVRRIEPPVAA